MTLAEADRRLVRLFAACVLGRWDEVRAVRDVHLREAKDREIFEAARRAGAVVMTKDADFPALIERFVPPPQVTWITCGNT